MKPCSLIIWGIIKNSGLPILTGHKVAENKLVKMGKFDDFIEFETPEDDEILNIISIFTKFGIEASVGG